MSPVFTCVPRESYCRGFRSRFALRDDFHVLQTPFVIWSQRVHSHLGNQTFMPVGLPDRRSIRWFLDFNFLSTAQSHLKVNYNLILILHQFKTSHYILRQNLDHISGHNRANITILVDWA